MRVAVTGANGFVGRHVVRALCAMDAEVIAVSRTLPAEPTEAASHVALDVSDHSRDPFRRLGSPDVLVHLAWGGLPNYKSARHVDVEFATQLKFLRSFVDGGLKHLMVSGTCLEYGMQSGELREDMPTQPTTAYGVAKDTLRQSLQGLLPPEELTWLRLFYLFGPGQAPSSLYSQLRDAVARGDESFDMSPGDQLRDFLPIEEAARTVALLALRPYAGGIVNVCSGRPVAVRDLVLGWLARWNASINLKIGVHPYPDYEPHSFWGSRTKLDGLLVAR